MQKKIIYYTIYAAFFMTGFSGLVYQIAWSRMLHLIFGVTLFAASTVVVAFMAGLFAGNLAAARIAGKLKRPLVFYAAIEAAVGIYGFFTPFLIEYLNASARHIMFNYAAPDPSSFSWMAVRFALCFFAFAVPTFLMGLTLPVLSYYLFSNDYAHGQALGILYGLNTLGAFAGAIAGGFFLIGQMGVAGSIKLAALINVAAAVLVYAASAGTGHTVQPEAENEKPAIRVSSVFEKSLIVFIAVSGFVSLGYEIVWTRVFSMFLKNAPHAFSAVLACYLAAVGAGALVYSKITQKVPEAKKKLYFAAMNTASIACAYFGYVFLHAVYLSYSETSSLGALYSGYISALVKSTAFAVFPASFFMGMTLPAAIELVIKSASHSHGVGPAGASCVTARLYSLNTLGAIAGTAATGFFLIPAAGINGAMAIFLAVSAALNILIAFTAEPAGRGAGNSVAALSVLVLAGAFFLSDTPFLIAESRLREIYPDSEFIFYREDAAASVGVDKTHTLFVDARPMTIKVSVLKLMAHLPLALAENKSRMLVICLGEGMTLKSAALHEGLTCDAVELSPGVIEAFKTVYLKGAPLKPGFKLIEDDGRNYVQFCRAKYDVITIDPPPPLYASGAINFHTVEFYERARELLCDGGVICQWFPFQTDSKTYMMALKSFAKVFPESAAWSVPENVGILMTGYKGPKLRIDMNKFSDFFKRPFVAEDIAEFAHSGLKSHIANPFYLVSLIKNDGASILKSAENLPEVTDDYPYLEFSYRRYCSELDYAYLTAGKKYINLTNIVENPGFRAIDMITGFDEALKKSADKVSERFAGDLRR